LKKVEHIIGILEKCQFFRRKLGKIALNRDHNIDPRPSASWSRRASHPSHPGLVGVCGIPPSLRGKLGPQNGPAVGGAFDRKVIFKGCPG
jgi:hypothetical protein